MWETVLGFDDVVLLPLPLCIRYAWSVLLAFLTSGEEEPDDEAFTNAPLDQNLLQQQSSSSYAPLGGN